MREICMSNFLLRPRAVIFDIDGTVACNKHRDHLLTEAMRTGDWREFYATAHLDKPRSTVIQLARSFERDGNIIVLVTSRSEPYREITKAWLVEHQVPFHHLYMRGDGDEREDTIVKHDIYLEQVQPKLDVHLVVEDRARVVKMWRDLGLECWQVQEGDF